MSREIFFVSDTHFGHANIIKFANRPFANVQEMDEALLANWNETVGVGDLVYHLGDVYFGDGWKSFDRVHGTVELIMGNHDHVRDKPMNRINKIHWWKKFIVPNPNHNFICTHAPLHASGLHNHHEPSSPFNNVHGHIHNNDSPPGQYINISVEKTGYKPIHIDELRTMIQQNINDIARNSYVPYY